MPKLSDHHASKIVKMLYIGDSGTGKTGSLVSLVGAGYNLRILDLDNGLDSLVAFVRKEFPQRLDQIEYETRRDTYKSTGVGEPVCTNPKAFAESMKLMDKWSDGTSPREWGENTIFVIDSFTALGKAAFEWARSMSPAAKDPRQWYFAAQQALEAVVSNLASEAFNTNLILISHINYTELADGTVKGYPSAVGSALGRLLPRYFNTMILAESSGLGSNTKRKIKTLPTGVIDLKNPKPFGIEATYDLPTGMAEIFAKLKAT